MTTDEMRALAEQCISHPASRTTGDIERAGMAIFELMEFGKSSRQDRKDADRLRWMLSGHGYFLEEEMLCGTGPTSDEEKAEARERIDVAMEHRRR